jgi:hypothetical protein
MVAGPDAEGVHWKTFSGDVLLFAQVPASALVPVVVPVNVPPAAGSTVGLAQVPDARVVLVVDDTVVVDVVVLVVVLGRGGMVTGTVSTLFVSDSSPMRLNGSTDTRSV